MTPQEIAALIELHCAAASPSLPISEFLQHPAPRTHQDRIPKIRAAVAKDLSLHGLKTITISKILRQPWTTTNYQIKGNHKPRTS